MINRNKGNHSVNTWEDQYYDGFEVNTYDSKLVSDWMKEGTGDCIEYLEVIDNDYLWYKNIKLK